MIPSSRPLPEKIILNQDRLLVSVVKESLIGTSQLNYEYKKRSSIDFEPGCDPIPKRKARCSNDENFAGLP